MFCDDQEGWDRRVGGNFKREKIYINIWLSPFVVQQKLTQHCKATISGIKLQELLVYF